jgi:hypothetical protein
MKQTMNSKTSKPAPTVTLHAPLPDHVFDQFVSAFGEMDKTWDAVNKKLRRPKASDLKEMFRLAQMGKASELRPMCSLFAHGTVKPLERFLECPELNLIHVVRLLFLCEEVDEELEHTGFEFQALLDHFRNSRQGRVALEDVAAVWRTLGLDDNAPGWAALDSFSHYHISELFDWEPDAIWPYFARRIELLEMAFDLRKPRKPVDKYQRPDLRRNALKFLCMFPEPPPSLLPVLWDLALGSGRANASAAQHCLERLPQTRATLLRALNDSKQQARAAAAQWLARLGAKEAIPLIQAALRNEKSDHIKGDMMTALERLGCPIDEFLDLAGLQREAERAKTIPDALKWFPFKQLPAVRWSNTGNRVEPLLLNHLIIQAHKLKSPEPTPLLRRYCALFRTADRETLGLFVLGAWIEKDLRKWTRAEMDAKWNKPGRTKEQVEQQIQYEMSFNKGTAIEHKGVLAVAGACCGANAAAPVLNFVREHRGARGAQGQALLQMLSAIEHPSAVQALARVAARFPARSLQDRAHALLQAVAERMGWTADQLADRNIPTLDLDASLKVTLDYGKRKFLACVGPDLEVTLKTPSGELLKALPEPRDGETWAPDAKRLFKSLKRDLKTIVQTQRVRLFESMVTQRAWEFEEWNAFLNQHPLVRRLCQGLVWATFEGEDLKATFRPLDDGSLADVADNPVQVRPTTTVRLAHGCKVPKKLCAEWLRHLADYKVEPPFDQFGRPAYSLANDMGRASELGDFEGHMIESRKLRATATKLGYRSGPVEDSAMFYEYRKAFPGIQLEAIVEFTGNHVSGDDRWCALRSLHFVRRVTAIGQRSATERPAFLGDLPPVLLSECWNDLRQIAAEGSGFDPEWEKKTHM